MRPKHAAAEGCVVLGDPGYYGRFGFSSDPARSYRGAALKYFQLLGFAAARPHGEVAYHIGFDAK